MYGATHIIVLATLSETKFPTEHNEVFGVGNATVHRTTNSMNSIYSLEQIGEIKRLFYIVTLDSDLHPPILYHLDFWTQRSAAEVQEWTDFMKGTHIG